MAIPLTSRQRAVQSARLAVDQKPVYIDTETTGTDRTAEIVEITIVDADGAILLDTLVRPRKPIPAEAMAIHHITNEMVAKAPPFPTLWPTIRGHLYGRVVATYNADFDLRMLQQSLVQYGFRWQDQLKMFCIMKLYAEYRGESGSRPGSYRLFSLDNAGRSAKITIPNSHRAKDDTLLARELLHYIAAQA